MRILLDASSFINLTHGQALPIITQLSSVTYHMGPLVEQECLPYTDILEKLFQTQLFLRVNDDNIPASLFLQLLQQYALGDGETECLALCAANDFIVACDDKKARETTKFLYGKERVIGSIGLLRIAIQDKKMSPEEAFQAYELMRKFGGFLPELTAEYFKR